MRPSPVPLRAAPIGRGAPRATATMITGLRALTSPQPFLNRVNLPSLRPMSCNPSTTGKSGKGPGDCPTDFQSRLPHIAPTTDVRVSTWYCTATVFLERIFSLKRQALYVDFRIRGRTFKLGALCKIRINKLSENSIMFSLCVLRWNLRNQIAAFSKPRMPSTACQRPAAGTCRDSEL